MNKNLNSINFDCTGCGLCKNICPFDAISIALDDEGFLSYKIDEEKCTSCGKCVSFCPRLNTIKINPELKLVYSAYIKDEEILKLSSSGGIFTAVANYIIENGGVVFGAAFNDEGKLEHICVDKKEDLNKLRGSKYIQSDISNAYIQIEKFLNENRKVLVSGVACQIVGFKRYFENHKNFTNLLFIDIVCHGVPSYKVYVDNLKKHKAFKIDFRNKKRGWNRYYINYLNEFGKSIKKRRSYKDPFFINYLKNIYLAKACYTCTANIYPRPGDISLGDFWNISNIDKGFFEINKDKGVSFVLINNIRAKEMFENIKDGLVYKTQELEEAIKYNPRISSGTYHESFLVNREKFFEKYNKKKK